jgi:hypothetical protein
LDPSRKDGFVGFRILSSAFKPSPHESLPPGITNTKGWTDDQVRKKLLEVKKQVKFDQATKLAKEWWEKFESLNVTRKALMLRLVEELAVRNATINDYYHSYCNGNTEDTQGCLYYLDYTRLKKAEQSGEEGTSFPAYLRWADWTEEFLASGFTNKLGWSKEQIRARLEEFKERLDWAGTMGSAKTWWEYFMENEDNGKLNLVLRLAEELAVRRATITEFYVACMFSTTRNVQANLHYLDYRRLKKEEKKNKEAAAQALKS